MDIDLQPEVGEIEPEGPKPIRKLTKDVINQIAAAEVRPRRVANVSQAHAYNTTADYSSTIKCYQGTSRKLAGCGLDIHQDISQGWGSKALANHR